MKFSHILALALGAASLSVAIAQEGEGPIGDDMEMPMETPEDMEGAPMMEVDGPEEADMPDDGMMPGAPPGDRAIPSPGGDPLAGPAAAPPVPCTDIAGTLIADPATAALASVVTSDPEILGTEYPELFGDLTDPAAELTVCVPPSEDVGKLVTLLTDDPEVTSEDIGDIIALHIANGKVLAADFLALDYGTVITTIGGNLTVYNDNGTVMLGTGAVNVTVTKPDTIACAEGSVVHQLDGILIPPGSSVTAAKIEAVTSVPLGDDGTIAMTPGTGPSTGDRDFSTEGPTAATPTEAESTDAGVRLWAAPATALALAAAALAL